VENLFWIFVFIMVAAMPFIWRIRLPRLAIMSYSFIALYLSLMTVAEGNLGTAFRHKSTILFAISTTLIVAGAKRRQRDEPNVEGQKSQITQ